MLATVSQTRSLKGSFYYDRALNNVEKNGHVVAANGIPKYFKAETQLGFLQAYCNQKYQVKAYNIVLSHSSEDKELLETNPNKKLKYVRDFLSELKKADIDIDNTPWILMEHTNTDCDHYHMIVLTTKFDGTRLADSFIGKKAAKAAYLASKKNDLHYAKGLEEREKARQKHLAGNFGEEVTQSVGLTDAELAKLKQVGKENAAADRKEKLTRQQRSIAEATARRERMKAVIESVAQYALKYGDLEYFKSRLLSEEGWMYGEDEKGNYTVTFDNGKRDVSYKLARLGVDTRLIDAIKEDDRKNEQLKKQEERKVLEDQKAKKAEELKRQEEEKNDEQQRPRWRRDR